MKKYLWTIAAIAAIVVSGCQQKEDEPVDETPAVLTSFKILAADNEGLKEDYAPASISESMVIRIPGGGQGKTLVATVSAGENDVIKVNDAEVTDGKASFDATYAVDIVVTNTKSKKSAQYEVKIGKILQLTSKKLGTFYCGSEMVYTESGFKAAVNPVSGEMYLAYNYTPADGSLKNVGVVKFSNGQFVQVGAEAIVPNPAAAVNHIGEIVFDKEGTPYVLYINGDVKNTFTIRKFDGSSWTNVGPVGFATKPGTTGAPHMYFDENGNPGVIYFKSDRNCGVTYLEEGAWKDGSVSQLPPYVKNGEISSNQGCYWNSAIGTYNGKQYGIFSINAYGFYVYELTGNQWSNMVVENFKPEGEDYALPGNLSIAYKGDKMLVFAALSNAKAMQIYEFNGNGFTPYGASFPIGIGSSGSADPARFGVNPVTGEIIAVKANSDKLIQFSSLNENKQWEDFTSLADAPATYTGIAFGFDKEGNALVVYPDAGRGTNGYHLYSIGLEDDVLPE